MCMMRETQREEETNKGKGRCCCVVCVDDIKPQGKGMAVKL